MDETIATRLLRVLSKCANLLASDGSLAVPALREAISLYWRLNPSCKPLTLLEMEQQIHVPLEDWLDEAVRGPYTGPLSIGGYPSPSCMEMALELEPAVGVERVQGIIRQVRDSCRLRNGGELLYRTFRSYIIQHPIIGQNSDVHDVFVPLGIGLADLYTEIPEHLKRDKLTYPCPVCGWPMAINSSPVTCGSQWCVATGGVYEWTSHGLVHTNSGAEISGYDSNKTWMLRPPIWQYTLIPGLLELSIARRIGEIGLEALLWPDVDTSDVRTLINDRVINIDAKVWRSAPRLATHLQSMAPSQDNWIVIPDYMERDLSYLREMSPLPVFTESGCLKEIVKLCKA
ncbi:hypothetical protein [Aeromonas veronii]|uniref:restriction endonuclease-related protein n=1 Tax=Aeromonas veronii TaxID=654 RepID=UPI001116B50B|nr:hypothetical protein [Aeromonas veronii]